MGRLATVWRQTVAVATLAAAAVVLAGCGGPADARPRKPVAVDDGARPADQVTPAAKPPKAENKGDQKGSGSKKAKAPSGPSSAERHFERVDRITGALTPKSVVASGKGLVVAQNMIYTHTVSAYSSAGELLATIDDRVTPSEFGYDQWDQQVKGGPVEAAFSPDGSKLWVSNYSTYGPGFGKPGDDVCNPNMGLDNSFLYRIDTKSLEIDDIVEVGSVPKYVHTTPDGKYVLVTNWCSWDLSVVTAGKDPQVVATVDIGRYPRGIEVSPDSRTAYVAVMGGSDIAVVDLARAVEDGDGAAAVSWFRGVGHGPRHLNLSPDGRHLFVTLNKDGKVAKVDTSSGKVVGTVATGNQPRSAVLSADGTALFVVNYESDTVSRVRTSDLEVLETVPVDHHPIGITYDASTSRIWVAAYVGSLTVFEDTP